MSIKAQVDARLSFLKGTELEKQVMQFINREVDSEAQRFKTAAVKAAKKISQESVIKWYSESGLSTGLIVASAIRTEAHFLTWGPKHRKTLRVTSYFDESVLDSMSDYYESAVRWNQKHSELCDRSPGLYIFDLRWEEGILGLPKKAKKTDTGWENDHFETSTLGSLKDFMTTALEKNIGTKAVALMRGRNQSMGAGMFSSNRGGISNLVHNESRGNL